VTHLKYEEKCVLYQYCLTILYEIFIVRFVINYLYCIYVFGLKQNVRITFKTSLTFFRQLRVRPFFVTSTSKEQHLCLCTTINVNNDDMYGNDCSFQKCLVYQNASRNNRDIDVIRSKPFPYVTCPCAKTPFQTQNIVHVIRLAI
jgi:hypothetical protein